MTRLIALLSLLLSVLFVAAQDHPRDSAADKSMVLALENAWNQAELHHDAGAADAILAETFISIDNHGKLVNRAQYMADLKDTSFNLEQLSNTDVTVHAYGDTVIVTAIYRAQGTASGKPFVHRGRFMDVWLRQNGKWQCVANQETHLRD